jgi:hypothetical protein
MQRTRRLVPFIERIFADAGYQGAKAATAVADTGCWMLEIVKRSEAHNFVVLLQYAGSSNEPWPG